MKIYSWVKSSLSEEGSRKSYYMLYSLAFLVLAFFCFSWFIFTGKSLVWYDGDGWYQHYKCLVYYSQYLRQILKDLLTLHRLVIPHWDFYIGEGADIINAMHYYVIGDPFALFSVFVPLRFMHYFFSFSCIFRLYLAGTVFSALCFYTGRKNRRAVLAGALSYALCYWAVLNAARHPYFLNPLINFPLMILGIEKIIRKERPYLFIAAAAVSAASNFYFFYMIAILAVFYALVRLAILYRKDLKQGVMTLLYMGVMALTGLAISGLIFLPVIMMFLGDSRMGVAQPIHWLYPWFYYSHLPAIFISSQDSYWLCLGFSAPAVCSLILLLSRRKQDLLLKVLLAAGFAVILFPLGGRLLNGMSYMSNRWCWAFVLLVLYIMVKEWDALFSLSGKEWKLLLAASLFYYAAILFLDRSRNSYALAMIPLFFISLLVLYKEDPAAALLKREFCLMLVISVSIVSISFWKFSPGTENYLEEFMENSRIWNEEWDNDETDTVRYFAEEDDPDNTYVRYSGKPNAITPNANMIKHISNSGYYFSISIPCVSAYRSDLQMREGLFQNYTGYDDRTALLTLAGMDYYVARNGEAKGLPYGYELLGTMNSSYHVEEKYREELKKELGTEELTDEQEKKIRDHAGSHLDVYKNIYALPIGYCYDEYVTEEVWESLDPVQKQELLLSAALTDREVSGIETFKGELPRFQIPYTMEFQDREITGNGRDFVTTSDSRTVTLAFEESVEGSELYVGLEGIDFSPASEYDLYFGDDSVDPLRIYNKANFKMRTGSDQIRIRKSRLFQDPVQDAVFTIRSSTGVTKTITYMQPDSTFSSGRKDFIASLGYSDDPVTSVTISFPNRGIYHFDDIKVYSVPMEGYEEKVGKLRENTLNNLELGTDSLDGDISVDEKKILCLAVPYSKGWRASVDGKEQSVLCLNRHYLGLVIEAGDHHVHFEYQMPYGKAGLILTMMGIAGAALIAAVTEKRKRR